MINPWSSDNFFDYERLKKEFGIGDVDPCFDNFLFMRKIIIGQRSLDYIRYSVDHKKPFNVMTGLMPSGEMHLGNKSAIDQVIYFQSIGGRVSISVADLESYSTRGISLEKAREVAINKYILNYIALGLKPCDIYFQSAKSDVQFLSYILGNQTNLNEMRSIYGFSLNDEPEDAKRKIMSAMTGGRDTEEEQRRLGGDPEKCPVFDVYNYEMADDKYVSEVFSDCKNGKRMCGFCKREISVRMAEMLKDLKEKREKAKENLSLYIHE